MISRIDLEEKYASFSNDELVEVIRNDEGYTAIAIEVAREELGRRKVTSDEISLIAHEQDEKVEYFIQNYTRAEMRFSQKVIFYFVFVPLFHFAMKQNLRDDGYLFKAKQAGYYSLMGFFFFILAGFTVASMEVIALLVWVAGLFAAQFLEKFLVKRDF